jgi:hypothetical protein
MLIGPALAIAVLAGCSSTPELSADPIADLRNPNSTNAKRLAAVQATWDRAAADPSQKPAARTALKDVAWAVNNSSEVRALALEKLFSDESAEGQADNRQMARLMLPRENSRAVVAVICKESVTRQWKDLDASLVRSWSRPNKAVKDEERAERTALVGLFPDKPVESVVFDVFVNPPPAEPTYGMKWEDRIRADAWDLLARLDADGSQRTSLLSSLQSAPDGSSSETINQLRSAVRDLRAIPLTGSELRWLASLRDPSKPQNQQWWGEASSVVQNLDAEKTRRFALRHAEPVRWAARYKPEYLTASREQLVAMIERRLSGREQHRRTADTTDFKIAVKQGFEYWTDQLRFADLVTILVIDDALQSPAVRAALFTQVQIDQKDTSTEYGGLLASDADGSWAATMYPPRPSQRLADNKFVASEEMITRGDRSLAHYHYHVQRNKNEDYAGPSDGDLEYARINGRSCLVFTTINENTLNADYYQPDGIVIDLGDIKRPAASER